MNTINNTEKHFELLNRLASSTPSGRYEELSERDGVSGKVHRFLTDSPLPFDSCVVFGQNSRVLSQRAWETFTAEQMSFFNKAFAVHIFRAPREIHDPLF